MDIDKLISEMTLEEKAGLCSGLDFWHTKPVSRLGLDSIMVSDGPNGLRTQKADSDHLGLGQAVTAVCFPTGSALGASFDTDIAGELGRTIADAAKTEGLHTVLGPAINMKRSPLCGRNFEYISEDPCLAGELAAAYVSELQKEGIGACVKHFAANNQEYCRMSTNTVVSERALREIYLRGFEIAVKESVPAAIMSSYNLINGVHAANSRDLCTVVAREEWGFQGVIMSDWNTTVPEDGSIPWKCAAAGNDIIMPGNCDDDENIRQAYAQGELTEKEIRECAGRIIALVKKLSEEVQK